MKITKNIWIKIQEYKEMEGARNKVWRWVRSYAYRYITGCTLILTGFVLELLDRQSHTESNC